MIWIIRNILVLLSSETSPYQLAMGVVFGMFLGFVPTGWVWGAILIFLILLRVNIGMAMACFAIVKGLSYLVWPLMVETGRWALMHESLRGTWTYLYNTPYIAVSGFNQPSVVGGIIFGLILSIPVFLLSVKFVNSFREKVLPHLEKLWIVKVLKGVTLL